MSNTAYVIIGKERALFLFREITVNLLEIHIKAVFSILSQLWGISHPLNLNTFYIIMSIHTLDYNP